MRVKNQTIDDELCILFPNAVLENLAWVVGRELNLKVVDTGMLLEPADVVLDRQMAAARSAMARYESVYAALAKS